MTPRKTTTSAAPFHVDERRLAHAAFWLGFAAGGLVAFCLSALAMSY